MSEQIVRTVVGAGMLFVAMSGVTFEPAHDEGATAAARPMAFLFSAKQASAPDTAARQWSATETRTAIENDWMNAPLARETEVLSALLQCQIDPDVGLDVFEAAKAVLAREEIGPFDVQARTVVDPEENFRIAEISFIIDADFEAVMRADRRLTRQLAKEIRVPFNLAVTVREASEQFA